MDAQMINLEAGNQFCLCTQVVPNSFLDIGKKKSFPHMEEHGDDEPSPHEDDMEICPETSNILDLNVGNANISTNGALNSVQSISSPRVEVDDIFKVGTVFKSDEDAYAFYTKYAKILGFNVRKDWSNRSKVHGRVVSRKLTCSKEGHRGRDKRDANVKKHRKETRTGCLAHLIIYRGDDGNYRVKHFKANHNHEVNLVDAQNLRELMSQETADVTGVTEAGLPSDLEIQKNVTSHFLGRRFSVRENSNHSEMKFDGYLKSGRTRDMKEGEAARLLYYFQKQRLENPSFFYSIQLDYEDRISNIFWADDSMVLDYDHFGDVICLDATCRTDEDFLPFVQFLGLNHHRQLVIFGAALMYDDSFDSIKWLFETFIEAVNGKKPKAILTDQDATIIQAINSVLPGISHRVCVWQMYQNSLQHLIHATEDLNSFVKSFWDCIFDHEHEEDFILAWDAMIQKFNLQQNAWLKWTFREKEKWAVVYGRNRFFMDKESTHLGEKFSKCLKNYLKPDLEVLQFFKKFEILVEEQRYKEFKANYEAQRCKPKLMANVALLKHASELYTPRAYEVFQREYEKSLNVVVKLCSENESIFKFRTNIFGQSHEYTVTFDYEDATVACSCMMFESVEILCCHGLKVLDHRNIKVVPTRYISKRWTREARVGNMKENSGAQVEENPKSIATNRYKELREKVFKISARASEFDQAYEYAAKQLDEVIQGMEKILSFKSSEQNCDITSNTIGANASKNEQADIFLDGNTTEVEKDDDTIRGRSGRDITPPDNAQVNNLHQEQCHFDFGSSHVVQSLYTQSSVTMHQLPNSDIYQSPDFLPNQNGSSYPAQLLQEPMSQINQLRQGMDTDVPHSHSTLFIHDDQRYRLSNGTY